MILLIALGVGAVAGTCARLLLPGRRNLNWAETIVVGILGSAIAAELVNLALGVGFDDMGPWAILASIAGTLVVLPIAEWIKLRFNPDPAPPSISELLAQGEGASLEFKTSARWNVHKGDRDERLERAVAEAAAGFMNATGGTLLIGVDATAEPVGLDDDLKLIAGGDLDEYARWLHGIVESCLGRPALANIAISFAKIERTDICRIDVKAGRRPVFVDRPKGKHTADFFVRVGGSTRELLADEMLAYQSDRGFGRRIWKRLRDRSPDPRRVIADADTSGR